MSKIIEKIETKIPQIKAELILLKYPTIVDPIPKATAIYKRLATICNVVERIE
jgi:hypothetical protein